HVDAIVIGAGRVGRLVSDMLTRHKIKHIIIEKDPATVAHHRAEGLPVYFGDAKNPLFLRRCGIDEAKGVVITINKASAVGEIVAAVRDMRDDILIVARARDAEHARHLYKQKVTDAVPETIEASL
ncbi:NAD-binding protein, partial [Microbacteriaceae bacterium K1510]|nr:NAD-binding protein [Microbacteriaceae bacterium K1510]